MATKTATAKPKGKFKENVSKAYTGLKAKVKNYTNDLKEAYKQGFTDGYNHYEKLPARKGAIACATAGYNKGLKQKRKYKKNYKKEK